MMSNRSTRATGLALAMTLLAGIVTPIKAADEPKKVDPPRSANGRRLHDFTLKSATDDSVVSLYGFRFGRAKAVVIVFTGTACPVSDMYFPRLNELATQYKSKGVSFIAVNSNAHESVEEIAKHAKERGITFPVLKDPQNIVADIALATRTPEVVVVDGTALVRYQGAVDDQYLVGKRKPKPEKNFLADALDSILADKPVEVAKTDVQGCFIDRYDPSTVKIARVRGLKGELAEAWEERDHKGRPVVARPNFAEHVAPILQAKCQSCHRPGQSGPFSLITFEDAKRWSGAIAEAIDEHRMPPWHADPRFGHFSNDRSLTPDQHATITAWIDQDTPSGDLSKVPAPVKYSEGWTVGKPDVVFEIPQPYTVAATGILGYQNFRVPTNFQEDKWVQVAEAAPGDKSVVHHIIVYAIDPKAPRDPAKRIHLCGYAPGDMPSVYPEGVAKRVPAGYDLVFQLHYTPNGKVRVDRSKVGLTFAKGPVKHEARTVEIAQRFFSIAPGDANSEVTSKLTLPKDAHLLSFMPHMHLRGKDFKYTLTPPGGKPEVMLSVPAYDFGWQSYYMLKEPRLLKAGSVIDCVAHFDNSKANPANPNPTIPVRWGDQTFEEMMIGYIDVYTDLPASSDVSLNSAR